MYFFFFFISRRNESTSNKSKHIQWNVYALQAINEEQLYQSIYKQMNKSSIYLQNLLNHEKILLFTFIINEL
jgi:hypothetical protein